MVGEDRTRLVMTVSWVERVEGERGGSYNVGYSSSCIFYGSSR